jgi:hypothetical protein
LSIRTRLNKITEMSFGVHSEPALFHAGQPSLSPNLQKITHCYWLATTIETPVIN